MPWLITNQRVGESLLQRPLLEKLDLNTRKLLAAAVDKHVSVIDVAAFFKADPETQASGRVAQIMEGVFYMDWGADDAQLEDDDFWLDLGSEDPAEKKVQMEQSLADACASRISSDRISTLQSLLTEYDDVVKIKLGEEVPADIKPPQIRLKPDSAPFRARPRKYPQEK